MENKTEKSNIAGVLLSLSGAFIFSFDTVLIRLASVSSWQVAFWRGLFVIIPISLILFITEKTTVFAKIKQQGFPLVLSGVLWGISGFLFVTAVKHTIAANVLVMISLAPFFAAIASYIFLKEKIKKGTLFLIILCAVGVFIIFYGDIGRGTLFGNFIGLLVPVTTGTNLAWMRKNKNISRMGAVIIGGFTTAFISSFFTLPLTVPPAKSLIYLSLLGLIVVPFAQLFLSIGTRSLPASKVAIMMMIETVLGPVWVWLFIGEIPPARTFLGGALILTGVTINSFQSVNQKPEAKNG
ncbi:MAG: DMT family transporter [Spirochaetaceae bacterium]|nr:DMT family transporter [Spirochaetaceae bacterium]